MTQGGTTEHTEAGGSTGFWAPGTHILWRYRENGGARIHIARPVTVVRDDSELLAVWMAPGTECVKPVIADGTPVHQEPLGSRYTRPRAVSRGRWSGTGVLKLARPGQPWSVWLFWDPGWRFKNWYVNLEDPLVRWSGGVDSEDHFLDISVHPDRSWHWRDEDEFAQAQRDGLVDAALAERVRAAGRDALAAIAAWEPPFSDGWQDWRPDPSWAVPSLPQNWDRTPARVSP
ncbi:cytidylyl-2-hydroxypropylphosphonate hydrolase [Streptomyces sp. bgisy022]|uniref:cytidylyl-2-hydroxypropylphosphonate hydrolase n=1 Tax=Streptomyces sp. bgisy022 TaxID=3413769 RepID=UPI003D715BFB